MTRTLVLGQRCRSDRRTGRPTVLTSEPQGFTEEERLDPSKVPSVPYLATIAHNCPGGRRRLTAPLASFVCGYLGRPRAWRVKPTKHGREGLE